MPAAGSWGGPVQHLLPLSTQEDAGPTASGVPLSHPGDLTQLPPNREGGRVRFEGGGPDLVHNRDSESTVLSLAVHDTCLTTHSDFLDLPHSHFSVFSVHSLDIFYLP